MKTCSLKWSNDPSMASV